MIVLLHMNGTFWPTVGIQGFTTGVSFFFVLSGFILRLVYGELRSAAEVRRFYVARIARIWPMHLLSIAALLLIVGDALPSWNVTAANVFLLQSWVPHPGWYFSLNGVSWSISTELAFYALFPFISARLTRTWQIKIALAVAGIIACSLIYPMIRPSNGDEATLVLAGLLYINPIARMLEFIVGMITADLYLNFSRDTRGSAVFWTLAEIAACALVAICTMNTWPAFVAISPISPQFAEWFLQSGQFWALAVLIFTFAIGRGALSAALSAKAFVFLGEISFSVYMLHQVIIRAMEQHMHRFLADHPIAASIAFIATTLVAAAVAFKFIERPSRDFIVSCWRRSTSTYDVGKPV